MTKKELNNLIESGMSIDDIMELAGFKFEEEKPIRERYSSYSFIVSNGIIVRIDDSKKESDNYRYISGNYFKTNEQAELYKQKLIIHQELQDLADELSRDNPVDWENRNQEKYYIEYCHYKKKFSQDYFNYAQFMSIHSTNENFLDIALERIGEYRLKILFDVK